MTHGRQWAAVIALLTAVVVVRVLVTAGVQLRAGEASLAAGRADEGVRQLRRAAHMYLPGSPYTRRAYDDLEAWGDRCEQRGERDQALVAWRAVRASALATRWLVVPYRNRLDRANHRIARLMALLPQPPEDRATPVPRLEERYLALLTEDRAPEPAWVLVMGAGLFLWLGAAAWAARNGWDETDRPRLRTLGWAGAAVGMGFLLFLAGLARA